MANVQHSALTGAELHEPKGAAAASADTVYVANGAGSGAWAKIDTANIDTTSIPSVNRDVIVVEIEDLSAAANYYVPFPHACTINKLATSIDGALATADAILTFKNGVGGSALGTSSITIAFTGSAAGDYDSSSPSTNNSFTADSVLEITCNGGPSAAVRGQLAISVTWN